MLTKFSSLFPLFFISQSSIPHPDKKWWLHWINFLILKWVLICCTNTNINNVNDYVYFNKIWMNMPMHWVKCPQKKNKIIFLSSNVNL